MKIVSRKILFHLSCAILWLASVTFLVREPARERYNAGIILNPRGSQALKIVNVLSGSAAEGAGLQSGDEIDSLNGKKVTDRNWLSTLNRYRQGDHLTVSFKRDGKTLTTTLILGPPDRFEYRIEERRDATSAQKALRAAWLRG